MPLLVRRFAERVAAAETPFDVQLPDGERVSLGAGEPGFRIVLRNARGMRALATLDSGRFGDAYVAGDIDLEGDMFTPFALRGSLGDAHPLLSLWRFVEPRLFGQVRANRRAIAAHYDIDPAFFLSFLDPDVPCYTQGVYAHDAETLSAATLRKFDWCWDRCALAPGQRLFEVGPGWGAWFEYASRRGVHCTGISNSRVSVEYLTRRGRELGHDWNLVEGDFLEYTTDRPYDAAVIMGVIEHLPDYGKVLRRLQAIVKPGGHVFVDASACTKKYELSSYMVKYIYGANHSFLVLHDFLEQLAGTSLELLELHNDRRSYFLTFRQWATNFDAQRDAIVARFGEFDYRRFRLYLWGAAYEFASRSLDCYRMVLRRPTG